MNLYRNSRLGRKHNSQIGIAASGNSGSIFENHRRQLRMIATALLAPSSPITEVDLAERRVARIAQQARITTDHAGVVAELIAASTGGRR